MCEPNYNPYPLVPSREGQNTGHGDFGWYEHDGQIRESQNKMMRMVEKMSERIATVEKAVLGIKDGSPSSTGSCASLDEKKRIPNQLSVSCLNNVWTSAVSDFFYI